MMNNPKPANIELTDNPSTAKGNYICINIDINAVLDSWKQSIFARDWLTDDGKLKPLDALKSSDRDKLLHIKMTVDNGDALARPVLGIGIMDHIEIGSARAVFIYLCALGHTSMSVHIPASNEKDFKEFLSD